MLLKRAAAMCDSSNSVPCIRDSDYITANASLSPEAEQMTASMETISFRGTEEATQEASWLGCELVD